MTSHSARKSTYTVTATALAVLLAACNTDAPTAAPSFLRPEPVFATAAGEEVDVVGAQRTKALKSDVVVSAVIDSKGGKIELKGTGFELTVPKGAVSVKTTFRVKALAGSLVAYEFEPHGATFAVPLTFSQSTKDIVGGTAGAAPVLGYFSSTAQLSQSSGSARVGEAWRAQENNYQDSDDDDDEGGGKRIEGSIYHFSGYLVSSGRR